jgi:hypothetical protein
MFYRVDYWLGLIVVGALIGWAVGRSCRAAGAGPATIAHRYYIASMVTVAVRVVAIFVFAALGDSKQTWNIARDLGSLIMGALFGLALAHRPRNLLREPEVLDALCLATGAHFAIGSMASMFAIEFMAQFFRESGYPLAFFKVIVAVELVGGLALFVRWTVPLGLAMLTVDMFGAIYTHLHNSDGIDADMDAFAMLVRLATIAPLWLLARAPTTPPRRIAALTVAGAAACLVCAIAGAIVVRQLQ